MWAMIVKELRELRRDRRTLAMMIVLPVLMLVIFGYAANFTVSKISTLVVGPQAQAVSEQLRVPFQVVEVDPTASKSMAETWLRDNKAVVAVVTGQVPVEFLMDGTRLFSVQTAESALGRMAQSAKASGPTPPPTSIQVLYNPNLTTSWVLVPGLAGLILVFIGTLITSLGVVRERQAGTLEQLAVMPFRPWDVIAGKIVPYLMVASFDLIVIVLLGIVLFSVPFIGSVAVFALGALLFLLVTLGLGVLISTVSQKARSRLGGHLSGGMRRKLAVAVALLHRPGLLVLDEPTTGVDPVSRAQLWRLISGEAASGTAVVVSTTYVNEAQRATSVILMERGRAVASGTPDDVIAAVPGAIGVVRSGTQPPGQSWRWGKTWRLWAPDGNLPKNAEARTPDFDDAVIVAELKLEQQ